MATGISTYLANLVLDAIFNAGSVSGKTPYLSLHTADPGYTGASELTGGSYARVNGGPKFKAAASRALDNDVEIQFTGLPACTVTHFGVWDAATNGNFLWGGQLGSSRTFQAGDFGAYAVGEFDASFS
jgi:hypothetical protein